MSAVPSTVRNSPSCNAPATLTQSAGAQASKDCSATAEQQSIGAGRQCYHGLQAESTVNPSSPTLSMQSDDGGTDAFKTGQIEQLAAALLGSAAGVHDVQNGASRWQPQRRAQSASWCRAAGSALHVLTSQRPRSAEAKLQHAFGRTACNPAGAASHLHTLQHHEMDACTDGAWVVNHSPAVPLLLPAAMPSSDAATKAASNSGQHHRAQASAGASAQLQDKKGDSVAQSKHSEQHQSPLPATCSEPTEPANVSGMPPRMLPNSGPPLKAQAGHAVDSANGAVPDCQAQEPCGLLAPGRDSAHACDNHGGVTGADLSPAHHHVAALCEVAEFTAAVSPTGSAAGRDADEPQSPGTRTHLVNAAAEEDGCAEARQPGKQHTRKAVACDAAASERNSLQAPALGQHGDDASPLRPASVQIGTNCSHPTDAAQDQVTRCVDICSCSRGDIVQLCTFWAKTSL